jgi:hypothetical protein
VVAHTPLIPALRRWRQADLWARGQPGLQSKFQNSQGYTEKPCHKNKTKHSNFRPGVVALTINPSTRKVEASRFLSSRPAWSTKWVPGQPGYTEKPCLEKQNKQTKKKNSNFKFSLFKRPSHCFNRPAVQDGDKHGKKWIIWDGLPTLFWLAVKWASWSEAMLCGIPWWWIKYLIKFQCQCYLLK